MIIMLVQFLNKRISSH